MLRSFFTLLAPIAGLMMVRAAPSEASEVSAVSEVTIVPSRPVRPQMLTAHAIENAPSPPSEVTIGPGASASPSRITADRTASALEGAVSEVTIQPGKVAPAPSARPSVATSGSQPDAGVKPAALISLP